MPELPEVETIKNQLSQKLPMTIKEVIVSPNIKSILKESAFDLINKKITQIERHGKKLIFHLDKNNFLLSGLGMSGSWQLIGSKNFKQRLHDHLVLKFNKDQYLTYYDPRRFGKMHIVNEDALKKHLAKLGIDANSSTLTPLILEKNIGRFPNRPIKVNLLDQSLIAGIGNYLASEICAHAKILPTRRTGDIKKNEWKNILKGIKISLSDSIKSSGNTFHGGYVDANGEPGEGVQNLVVFYQDICQMCHKTKVSKIILGGRGTYFCPKCQS